MTTPVEPQFQGLAKFIDNIALAVSPEFRQGRNQEIERRRQNRLFDLKVDSAEQEMELARQSREAKQMAAQKNAEREQQIQLLSAGRQAAQILRGISDPQQRTEVLSQQLPQLQSLGLDREDLDNLFDQDFDVWNRKLDNTILAADAFIEHETEKLNPGQSLVRGGKIELTAPFKPEKPSAIESKLLAEGFRLGTPEAQSRARQLNERSGVNVNVGAPSFKVPSGFMLADPENPSRGVVPIPGGPAERQTPEAAAKTQMLESARNSVAEFAQGITLDDGTVDRRTLVEMASNLPFSKGRQLRVLILDAVEAKLRAESGAAVPDSEVKRASNRFIPSLTDNDQTIFRKMNLLSEFVQGASEKISPTKNAGTKSDFDFEYDPTTGTFK